MFYSLKTGRFALCCLISSLLAFWGNWAHAQQKPRNTVPQAPKRQPKDPLRVFPGIQVPEQPDRWTWQITNKFAGQGEPIGDAPPVYFMGRDGKAYRVGTIQVGTTVELKRFTVRGKMNYWLVPWEGTNSVTGRKNETLKEAWVNGNYIIPTAFKGN